MLHEPTFKAISPRANYDLEMKVYELIDWSSDLWNEGLIKQLFLEFEAQSILAMPLSQSPSKDCLVWHYSNDGAYSTKSCYKFIRWFKGQELRASSSKGSTTVWKKTWSLPLPPKVKVFIWRACNKALPVGKGLTLHIKGFDLACSHCCAAEEDVVHALVKCPTAQKVWETLNLDPCDVLCLASMDFLDWWEHVLKVFDQGEACKFGIICWCLWKARNDHIFKLTPRTHDDVVGAALSYYASFIEVNSPADRPRNAESYSWRPPP